MISSVTPVAIIATVSVTVVPVLILVIAYYRLRPAKCICVVGCLDYHSTISTAVITVVAFISVSRDPSCYHKYSNDQH